MFKNKFIILLIILNIAFYNNPISSFFKNKYRYGTLLITIIGINQIYNIKKNENILYENNLKLFLLQKKINNLPETEENKILASEINNYFKYQNSLFDIKLQEIPKIENDNFLLKNLINASLSKFILNKTINDDSLIFSEKETILKKIKEKEKLEYFKNFPYLIEINIHENSFLYEAVELLNDKRYFLNNKSLKNIIEEKTKLDLLNVNINNEVCLIIKNEEYNNSLSYNFSNLINEIDNSFYELKKNELEYEKFCEEYNKFNNKNGPIAKKINIQLSNLEIQNNLLYALKLTGLNNFQNYNKTQALTFNSSNSDKTIINVNINNDNNSNLKKLGFYTLSKLDYTVEINKKVLLTFNKVN